LLQRLLRLGMEVSDERRQYHVPLMVALAGLDVPHAAELIEHGADQRVGLLPQHILVVGADGVRIPVHPVHHERFSIHHQAPTVGALFNEDAVFWLGVASDGTPQAGQ
jgi:hypothetical protein